MADHLDAKAALDLDLTKRCKKYHFWATLDYAIALALMGITVISAALGTVGALLEYPKELVALASALPALLALVSSAYKFQQRANWHYRMRDGADALKRRLKFQQLDSSDPAGAIAAVDQDLSALVEKMGLEWEREFSLSWVPFSKPVGPVE